MSFVSQKKNALAILYIVSMTIAFTTRYGNIMVGYQVQIIIGLIWIAIAFYKFWINGFVIKGEYARDYPRLIKLYLLPQIIIHLYAIVLAALGKAEWELITTNLTVYVPIMLAILSIYLFRLSALKYISIAFILSWLLSVGTSMIAIGPHIFSDAIKQGYFNVHVTNYLELHDTVLAVGYIITFYFFSKSQVVKRDILIYLAAIMILILGVKRIAVLALLLLFVFICLTRKLSLKNRYKICIISGIIVFFACYAFIYILSEGNIFYNFIEHYQINTMGRVGLYQYVMSHAEFGPSFIGLGRNAVFDILSNGAITYVHSDIIRNYVENGFILFGLWAWYYLVYMTKSYKKYWGYSASILYFIMTLYSFTLYFTDNVEVYFICQILSITIPVTYAFKQKRERALESRSELYAREHSLFSFRGE